MAKTGKVRMERMSLKVSEGINCRVVEVYEHSTLRWFGHLLERMGGNEWTKRIYISGVIAVGVRGRIL